jgi:hypothetical protein
VRTATNEPGLLDSLISALRAYEPAEYAAVPGLAPAAVPAARVPAPRRAEVTVAAAPADVTTAPEESEAPESDESTNVDMPAMYREFRGLAPEDAA